MSRSRPFFPLLLALAMATLPAAPAVQAATGSLTATYREGPQRLAITYPSGVVPTMQELANPPRLVIDLPGVNPARQHDDHLAEGLVSRYVVAKVKAGTRIVLTLRAPLHGAYQLTFGENGLGITLLPHVGATPPAKATPRPSTAPTRVPTAPPASARPAEATPHPKPRPTAIPTLPPTAAPRPSAMPTLPPTAAPRPSVIPTLPPTPAPTPSIKPTLPPSAAPTLPPTAAPVPSPHPLTPAPAITPAAIPMPTPHPVTPAPVTTPTTVPSPIGASAASASPSPQPSAPTVSATSPRPSVKPPAKLAAKPKPKPKPSPKPLVLALKAARPASGNYTHVTQVVYDESSRYLSVAVSRHVLPKFGMKDKPPVLVMDLPGTVIGKTQGRALPHALVAQWVAYQLTPTSTRIQLTFARSIGQDWVMKQGGGKLVLMFDRRPLPAAATAHASD